MPPARKVAILRWLCFLIIGAVISWAIAIAGSADSPREPHGFRVTKIGHHWWCIIQWHNQMTESWFYIPYATQDDANVKLLTYLSQPDSHADVHLPPMVQRVIEETSEDALAYWFGHSYEGVITLGWPMKCFKVHAVDTSLRATSHRYQGSIELGKHGKWLVPWVPMVPGLVVNAAIYSLIPFGVFIAAGTLRRWALRRRGLCEACGYNRAGLDPAAACPECGERSVSKA